jgi:hypothetical protein
MTSAHTHNERCEELREALSDLRSNMVPPQRDTAFPGFQRGHTIDPSDVEPDIDPDIAKQIEAVEQALRDEGCEPD